MSLNLKMKNMDTLYKKLLLFATTLVFGLTITAQEKVSKKVTKSYKFTNGGELHLENKYGNITPDSSRNYI